MYSGPLRPLANLFQLIFYQKITKCRLGIKKIGMFEQPYFTRLGAVEGLAKRYNDVIYCGPISSPLKPSTVVFFGGDVQDYPEVMERTPENKKYLQWNLENTLKILNLFFNKSHTVVIRPSRVEKNVYSCYDNFVVSDEFGTPDHDEDRQAIKHLLTLLGNAAKIVNQSIKGEQIKWSYEESELILVGFSKGCVVLNQLVCEMSLGQNEMAKRLKHVYWLDGGHGGEHTTWITSDRVLASLASTGVKIWVHMTPYQIQKKHAPIKEEEEAFCSTLKSLGAQIERSVHFAHEPPLLEAHFKLLEAFSRGCTHPYS